MRRLSLYCVSALLKKNHQQRALSTVREFETIDERDDEIDKTDFFFSILSRYHSLYSMTSKPTFWELLPNSNSNSIPLQGTDAIRTLTQVSRRRERKKEIKMSGSDRVLIHSFTSSSSFFLLSSRSDSGSPITPLLCFVDLDSSFPVIPIL